MGPEVGVLMLPARDAPAGEAGLLLVPVGAEEAAAERARAARWGRVVGTAAGRGHPTGRPQVRKTPSWPRSWANFSLL